MPVEAGIHVRKNLSVTTVEWIPACAGMTLVDLLVVMTSGKRLLDWCIVTIAHSPS